MCGQTAQSVRVARGDLQWFRFLPHRLAQRRQERQLVKRIVGQLRIRRLRREWIRGLICIKWLRQLWQLFFISRLERVIGLVRFLGFLTSPPADHAPPTVLSERERHLDPQWVGLTEVSRSSVSATQTGPFTPSEAACRR